ncbi:hypothetical protein PsorP6_001598 [Peronosclerospora sorghi]|uniref:Uncharacterized protein n=1 Tax=Peronosclerospora sorghi TaxID=230839 RepID=A0ACC0WV82_9STRA|nr:hypothetical protein PsorP6_001598 [Peronosclerospora sorghi]
MRLRSSTNLDGTVCVERQVTVVKTEDENVASIPKKKIKQSRIKEKERVPRQRTYRLEGNTSGN